jgi:pimeloyl-ACP methyl ester carboxylesterase
MTKPSRFAGLLIVAVLAMIQVASASRRDTPKSLALKPCEVQGAKDAKCGAFEVFENRDTRKGRKISINVLVLPATGQKREPDPLFYFAGGPGSSAVEDGPGIAKMLASIRESRDLVFVDQRGTGQSNPLNCDLFDVADPQSFFGAFLPLDAVRKCREQLELKADLTLYTTNIAMDDIDDVRAALGYDQINLYGGSYGTRAALVYMRRHPQHVRAAVLHGVSPTNQFMPLNFPQDTERALQGVLSECEADDACRAAFPQAKADAKRVLEQLLQSPAEAEVQIPNSTNRVKLKLNRNLAAEAIRYMLYSPNAANRIPLVLHQAAEGNFGPLTNAAFRYRMFLVATGSNGMYLSVTCAEDLPFVNAAEAEKLGANTFLGDYRYRDQSQACAVWPKGSNGPDYAKPVRSNKPVLIVTGEWDPVTPPAHGDAVAKTLSNSLHVVVPDGAHALGGLENIQCLDQLMTQFISRGSVKDLDTACVKSTHRRGFALQ